MQRDFWVDEMSAKRKRLNDNADKFIFGDDEPSKKATTPAKKPEKKSNDLLNKLTQESAPREKPIRVSLDLTPDMHAKLTNLANRTGRKKSEILRILLEQAFDEINIE